jgi:hypothetical protein
MTTHNKLGFEQEKRATLRTHSLTIYRRDTKLEAYSPTFLDRNIMYGTNTATGGRRDTVL